MRRFRSCLAALAVCASTAALAGEIYGTVTEGGKSVGEGVGIGAKCGEKGYPAVQTDKSGTYHVVVAENGKCTLTLSYKGQSPSIEVASYDEGAQVDLVLEVKDSKYSVRRK